MERYQVALSHKLRVTIAPLILMLQRKQIKYYCYPCLSRSFLILNILLLAGSVITPQKINIHSNALVGRIINIWDKKINRKLKILTLIPFCM